MIFLSLTLLNETFGNGSWLCPGFPGSSTVKESAFNAGDHGLIPWLGRSPGEGIGYPLQYSGLENAMDCIVHRDAKSWTQLNDFHFRFHFHSFVRHNWATYTCPQHSTLAEGGGRESRTIQEGTSILDICVKTESQPGVPFDYELSSTMQTWNYYFEMWCREKKKYHVSFPNHCFPPFSLSVFLSIFLVLLKDQIQHERQNVREVFQKLRKNLKYEEVKEMQKLKSKEEVGLRNLADSERVLIQQSQLVRNLISDVDRRLKGSTTEMLQVTLGRKPQYLWYEHLSFTVRMIYSFLCF